MFTLEYTNDIGTLVIGGGKCVWNATDVTGLGLNDKDITAVTFSGEHGRLTTDAVYRERTITISGDITSDNLTGELSKAVAILSREGDITINKKRRIHCNCATFPDPKRMGRFAKFTIQFICDNPYFTETEDICISVLDVLDLVCEGITFPAMLSKVSDEGCIDIIGEDDTPPKFYISNFGDVMHDGITIVNDTTGKSISLSYFPKKYQTIVIDIDKRKAETSDGENLLKYLSPETRLSEFYLGYGKNKIRLEDKYENISVTARYKNKYASAVY